MSTTCASVGGVLDVEYIDLSTLVRAHSSLDRCHYYINKKVIVTLGSCIPPWMELDIGIRNFFLRQIRQSGKIPATWQNFGNVAIFWQRGKINV
jgi:hypothetical protein